MSSREPIANTPVLRVIDTGRGMTGGSGAGAARTPAAISTAHVASNPQSVTCRPREPGHRRASRSFIPGLTPAAPRGDTGPPDGRLFVGSASEREVDPGVELTA